MHTMDKDFAIGHVYKTPLGHRELDIAKSM